MLQLLLPVLRDHHSPSSPEERRSDVKNPDQCEKEEHQGYSPQPSFRGHDHNRVNSRRPPFVLKNCHSMIALTERNNSHGRTLGKSKIFVTRISFSDSFAILSSGNGGSARVRFKYFHSNAASGSGTTVARRAWSRCWLTATGGS